MTTWRRRIAGTVLLLAATTVLAGSLVLVTGKRHRSTGTPLKTHSLVEPANLHPPGATPHLKEAAPFVSPLAEGFPAHFSTLSSAAMRSWLEALLTRPEEEQAGLISLFPDYFNDGPAMKRLEKTFADWAMEEPEAAIDWVHTIIFDATPHDGEPFQSALSRGMVRGLLHHGLDEAYEFMIDYQVDTPHNIQSTVTAFENALRNRTFSDSQTWFEGLTNSDLKWQIAAGSATTLYQKDPVAFQEWLLETPHSYQDSYPWHLGPFLLAMAGDKPHETATTIEALAALQPPGQQEFAPQPLAAASGNFIDFWANRDFESATHWVRKLQKLPGPDNAAIAAESVKWLVYHRKKTGRGSLESILQWLDGFHLNGQSSRASVQLAPEPTAPEIWFQTVSQLKSAPLQSAAVQMGVKSLTLNEGFEASRELVARLPDENLRVLGWEGILLRQLELTHSDGSDWEDWLEKMPAGQRPAIRGKSLDRYAANLYGGDDDKALAWIQALDPNSDLRKEMITTFFRLVGRYRKTDDINHSKELLPRMLVGEERALAETLLSAPEAP